MRLETSGNRVIYTLLKLRFAKIELERMLGVKTPYLEVKSMIRSFLAFCAFATALTTLTGCYRMPTDDDYSLIPCTNNPQITRQRQDNVTPKVSY